MSVEITSQERSPLIERHGRDRKHEVALTGGVTLMIIGLLWAILTPNAGLPATPLDQSVLAFAITVSGLGAVVAMVATASARTKPPQETAEETEQDARTCMRLTCVIVTCAKLSVLGGLLFATLSALKVQT